MTLTFFNPILFFFMLVFCLTVQIVGYFFVSTPVRHQSWLFRWRPMCSTKKEDWNAETLKNKCFLCWIRLEHVLFVLIITKKKVKSKKTWVHFDRGSYEKENFNYFKFASLAVTTDCRFIEERRCLWTIKTKIKKPQNFLNFSFHGQIRFRGLVPKGLPLFGHLLQVLLQTISSFKFRNVDKIINPTKLDWSQKVVSKSLPQNKRVTQKHKVQY